jgi:hypothetical protein
MIKTLDNLLWLQINLDKDKCIEIFGDVGAHLYGKFQIDRNIITFYAKLDKKNRRCLSDYLEALCLVN